MIVVTGACRTGTSLMMQTLLKLGLTTPAKPFSPGNHPEGNPHGYYELSKQQLKDINDSDYYNKTVKLDGITLNLLLPELIEHLIVCKRDKQTAITSAKKWMEYQNKNLIATAEEIYDLQYQFINNFTNDFKIPYLTIYYENMIEYPVETIIKIAKYLDLEPTTEQLDAAFSNVLIKDTIL